ncbi:hypothetical protein D3C78_726910 [compost metagenome]
MNKLQIIRDVFLNALGSQGTGGLCHAISYFSLRHLNKTQALGKKWIICRGHYHTHDRRVGHYWLESTPNGQELILIDVTADQFGAQAPYISQGRPREYVVDSTDQEEILSFIEPLVSSWEEPVARALRRDA